MCHVARCVHAVITILSFNVRHILKHDLPIFMIIRNSIDSFTVKLYLIQMCVCVCVLVGGWGVGYVCVCLSTCVPEYVCACVCARVHVVVGVCVVAVVVVWGVGGGGGGGRMANRYCMAYPGVEENIKKALLLYGL